MLIARCISALRGGAANQRGRSPHSDSEQLPASLTPLSPTRTTACLRQQQLQAVEVANGKDEVEDEEEERLKSQLMESYCATCVQKKF